MVFFGDFGILFGLKGNDDTVIKEILDVILKIFGLI